MSASESLGPAPRVPGQNIAEKRPPFVGPSERRAPPELPPLPPERRVGFAVIGLGRLALEQVLPAFGATKFSRPAAIVSGDRAKARRVAAEYGVPDSAVHDYEHIGELRGNADVQVAYVITPNGLHLDHVRRAAAAGKHVLCEKPMATNSAQAEAMIAACNAAGRQADDRLPLALRAALS